MASKANMADENVENSSEVVAKKRTKSSKKPLANNENDNSVNGENDESTAKKLKTDNSTSKLLVKKSRGRPPKSQKSSIAADLPIADSSSSCATKVNNVDKPTTKMSQNLNPVKRGRGRPPNQKKDLKTATAETKGDDQLPGSTLTNDKNVSSDIPASAKKAKGRPKGKKNQQKTDVAKNERGRPKKDIKARPKKTQKLKEDSDSVSQDLSAAEPLSESEPEKTVAGDIQPDSE